MPRNAPTRKTSVTSFNQFGGPVSGVVAQGSVAGRGVSDTAAAAQALAGAFGVAGQVIEDREKRAEWSRLDARADVARQLPAIEKEILEGEWTNLSEEEVLQQLDGRLESEFGEARQDKNYREGVAKPLERFTTSLIAKHREGVTDKQEESDLLSLSDAFSAETASGVPIDYTKLANDTHDLFRPKNRASAYAMVLSRAAVQASDETIIDNSPDRFASGAPTPKNSPEVQKARAQAQRQRVEAELLAETTARGELHAGLTLQAQGGALNFEAARAAATPDENGNADITENQYKALLVTQANFKIDEESKPIETAAVAGGSAQSLTQSDYDKSMEALTADMPDDQRDLFIAERNVSNGRLTGAHKRAMENSDPANTEAFQSAYAMYRLYEDQRAGFMGDNLKAAKVRQFDDYELMLERFGPQAALEKMQTGSYDYSLVETAGGMGAIGTAVDDALETVRDLPWSLKEVDNSPMLRKALIEETRLGVALGLTVDEASTRAAERVKNTTVHIDGYLHPAAAWGGGDAAGATQFYKETTFGEDAAEDWQMRPAPGNSGQVYFYQAGTLLTEPQLIDPRDLMTDWQAESRRRVTNAAVERAGWKRRDLERAVASELVPADLSEFSAVGDSQLDYFHSLPKAKQDSLLEAHIAKERAEREALEAAKTAANLRVAETAQFRGGRR